MAIVLGASVTLAWGLPDEKSAYAEGLLDEVIRKGARVPAIWTTEVINAVLMAERAKRLSSPDVDAFLSQLSGLCRDRRIAVIQVAPLITFAELPPLARQHRLTSYDACYLHLALAERLALASLDDALIRAARELGIAICS